MGEKLVVIEHKDLAGKTLTVPKEVSEDGKLILDEKGQATLPSKAASFLCTVPGFSVVEKKEIGKPIVREQSAEGGHEQEQEKTDEEPEEREGEADKKYPDGDPNPNWKKEELAAWLTEREIEFKPKDGKEVLLGKAFKFLESSKEKE